MKANNNNSQRHLPSRIIIYDLVSHMKQCRKHSTFCELQSYLFLNWSTGLIQVHLTMSLKSGVRYLLLTGRVDQCMLVDRCKCIHQQCSHRTLCSHNAALGIHPHPHHSASPCSPGHTGTGILQECSCRSHGCKVQRCTHWHRPGSFHPASLGHSHSWSDWRGLGMSHYSNKDEGDTMGHQYTQFVAPLFCHKG